MSAERSRSRRRRLARLVGLLLLVALAREQARRADLEGARATTGLALAFRRELRRESPLDRSLLAARGELDFVFVGGFLSEAIPGYFDDNVSVVRRELGASAATTFPPSRLSLAEEADALGDEALARFRSSGRAVVLVGHSMGGASAVLAVLRRPELVLSGRVARVVAIQAPLGGSPIAESVSGSLPLPSFARGLPSLGRREARGTFSGALERARARLSPDDLSRLSGRVSYVRSEARALAVSLELLPTSLALAAGDGGASDGLVLARDMRLEGFGEDLGVLSGDHASLVVSSVLSSSSAAERRAFTRALVRELFARDAKPGEGAPSPVDAQQNAQAGTQ